MENKTLKELKAAYEELRKITSQHACDCAAEMREIKVRIELLETQTPDDCCSSVMCYDYNTKHCNINCKTYANE